jgi:hypothetical protein
VIQTHPLAPPVSVRQLLNPAYWQLNQEFHPESPIV